MIATSSPFKAELEQSEKQWNKGAGKFSKSVVTATPAKKSKTVHRANGNPEEITTEGRGEI